MKGPIKDHSYECPKCGRILIDHSDFENDAEYLYCQGLESCTKKELGVNFCDDPIKYKKSELKKHIYVLQ